MIEYNILVINPGSTSDEVSYFRGEKEVFHKTVRYSPEELKPYDHEKITAQFDLRKKMVLGAMAENKVPLGEVHAIIGRGGVVKPIESGVYTVDEALLKDLRECQ
jgi:butyrate kinase